jgi:2'-5' RNA ligase
MRLFIAINFNNDTRSRLLALRDELRDKSQRGNFSAPENLHLTLAFLGECDDRRTAAAKSALSALPFHPLYVTIENTGYFPGAGGNLWWAGIQKTNALKDLHRTLRTQLETHGFESEKRGFSPHITLGREVVTDMKPRTISPFGETVSAIELMKSERINGKLTYTAIWTRGV